MAIGGLDDYAQALGAAQQLVPNWRQGDLVESRLQGDRLQNQAQQIAITDHDRQQAYAEQQRTAFQTDLGALGAKPTPQAYRALAVKYPQFHEVLDGAAKGLVGEQAQSLVKRLAPVQALAANGDWDGAAKEVKRHIDADVAAGLQPDPDDQEMYDSFSSGNLSRQKAAAGVAYALLNQINPETAAKNIQQSGADEFASTGDGAIYSKRTGSVVREGPAKESNALEVPIYDDQGHRVGTQLVANGGKGGGQGSGGGAASGSGAAPAGRTVGGWTPRARNGGDNTDATVDGKIAGMAKALGVSPTDPLTDFTPIQIAGALALSEGGPGSLADRNNNPGNLTDSKTGAYRKFPTKAAGLQAAAAQVARNLRRGQTTIQTMVEGLPVGGRSAPASTGPNYFGPVSSGGGNGSDPDATGPAYLATLTPGRRAIVQSILDGKQAAPKPGSRFGEALAEDVARVDPSFDPSVQPARLQARKDFTGNGKASQALTSFNRFAAHLNSAWHEHLKLGGANLGPLSGVAAGVTQSFSPQAVNRYNTELEGIAGEFQKLTKNGVANEGETNRLIHNARAAQSEAGRAGALQAMASLVAGAYQPLVRQWQSAFPGQKLPNDVSAASKAVINNIIHGGTRSLPTGSDGAPQARRAANGFRVLSVRPR